MSIPDYKAMVEAYERAMSGSKEPDMIILGAIRKTKAVRRKIGRFIKRGQMVKGQVVFPLTMHGHHGAAIA